MTFKLMATKYCETTIFNGTFHRFNVLLSLHSFLILVYITTNSNSLYYDHFSEFYDYHNNVHFFD